MVKTAGFDLVWFGIFLVMIVEMAEVSPPVGFNLFVLQTMSGKDSNDGRAGGAAVLLPQRRRSSSSRLFPQIVMYLPNSPFRTDAPSPTNKREE
jgi:TRAP-type C4-dicarboxylate transport system permease large subunit